MYQSLSNFRICEPFTVEREESSFLNNFTQGKIVDFRKQSTDSFSQTLHEYEYDGTLFSTVVPVDKYGLQENFIYESKKLRRKEMFWETSVHPIKTNPSDNSGFNLFGNIIGIKKIGTVSSLEIIIASQTIITVSVESYNSSNGEIELSYANLPSIYEEVNSENIKLFNIETLQDWKISTYNNQINENDIIKTPYGIDIGTEERLKEISFTLSSFNKTTKRISGITNQNLNNAELWNIKYISPNNQTIRIIPMGFFNIENNINNIPTALSINGMRNKVSLGVLSEFYYGIPYQTGFTYTETSKDYVVRVPSFILEYPVNANLFMFAIALEKTGNDRINPNGFIMGIK